MYSRVGYSRVPYSYFVQPASAGGGISGTLSATLASVTLSAAATLELKGQLATTLADATLSAAGTLALKGQTAATLADVASLATSTLSLKGQLAATLAGATLSAAGKNPNASTPHTFDTVVRQRRRRRL